MLDGQRQGGQAQRAKKAGRRGPARRARQTGNLGNRGPGAEQSRRGSQARQVARSPGVKGARPEDRRKANPEMENTRARGPGFEGLSFAGDDFWGRSVCGNGVLRPHFEERRGSGRLRGAALECNYWRSRGQFLAGRENLSSTPTGTEELKQVLKSTRELFYSATADQVAGGEVSSGPRRSTCTTAGASLSYRSIAGRRPRL